MKRFLFFIIFFFFLAFFGWGQIYNFRQFSIDQGLSQSQVFDICQDETGSMWFATYGGGITIYDGLQARYLNAAHGLPSYSVISLLNDRKNNIWIGTAKGLTMFNGSGIVNVDKNRQLSHYWIWDIVEDKNGTIWIGTDLGAWYYKKGEIKPVLEKRIASSQIFSIFVDSDNNLWFSTFNGGVIKYDGRKYYYNLIDSTANMMVEAIFEDHKHNIWVGSDNGLYRLNGKEKIRYSVNNGLPDNHILSLNEDQAGNLWIGTENAGIVVFDGTSFTNIGQDQGIQAKKVYKIFKDNTQQMWVATDGAGAFIFNGFAFKHIRFPEIPSRVFITSIEGFNEVKYFGTEANGIIKYLGHNDYLLLTNSEGLPDNSINKILKTGDNTLWIGTDNGLSRLNTSTLKFDNFSIKDGLAANNITTLSYDQNQWLWIGTYGAGISIYNRHKFLNYSETDGLASNYIWDILQSREGTTYLATENGLTVYENKNFRSYYKSDGLPANKIWSLAQDMWGNIWIGSEGISRFDGKKFINYNTTHGLSSNMIFLIHLDSKNNLIIGTEKGLDKITVDKEGKINKIVHFGRKEGFMGIETNTNAVYSDDEGKVWFGTIDGVSIYDPWEDFGYVNEPKVQIKKINLFYEESDFGAYSDSITRWNRLPANLKLPYKKNSISFEFITLDFNIPENVKYQYKLEGLDQNWLPVTSKNTATYTNLSPGHYTFLVNGCNSKDVWSKIPASFSFVIQRPVWLTWWFYLIISLLVLGLIFLFIFYRTKNINKKRRILEIKIEKRTLELNKQKNALEKALKLNDEQRAKLERANEEIKLSSKLKEQFLANTSHEIRTPLNIIMGFTNLLSSSISDSKQIEYLNNIKTAGNNLMVILNDILDFSKIEADKLTIEEINFDFSEFIQSIISMMSVNASEKNIDIRYHIDQRIPQYLKGDPVRLNQVLTNLLRNSIKFTNEGGWIKLEIDLLKDTDKQVTIYFQVIDNGIGIDSSQIDKIFESFNQASNETTRKYGGTGLGLSITKKIIDLMEGKIGAYSEVNKGSTFYFQLNFKKGHKLESQPITQSSNDSSVFSNLTILLVEDNPVNATLAFDTIKQFNSTVIIDHAINGLVAIEKIKEKKYDIVIMDIQMPEMDGYEATRVIRNQIDTPEFVVPILGMSAHAMKIEKDKCMALGMNDYITKPFDPAELFQKIQKLVNRKIEINNLQVKHQLNLNSLSLNYINLSILHKTYNGDAAKIAKILGLYLKDVPKQISDLNNHYEAKNWVQVKTVAHSLKTSFKYLGAEKANAAARHAEIMVSETKFDQIGPDIPVIINEWNKINPEISDLILSIQQNVSETSL